MFIYNFINLAKKINNKNRGFKKSKSNFIITLKIFLKIFKTFLTKLLKL